MRKKNSKSEKIFLSLVSKLWNSQVVLISIAACLSLIPNVVSHSLENHFLKNVGLLIIGSCISLDWSYRDLNWVLVKYISVSCQSLESEVKTAGGVVNEHC